VTEIDPASPPVAGISSATGFDWEDAALGSSFGVALALLAAQSPCLRRNAAVQSKARSCEAMDEAADQMRLTQCAAWRSLAMGANRSASYISEGQSIGRKS
jgi:hypothetical protein